MDIQKALSDFLSDYSNYDHEEVERLRAEEYQRIDQHGHAYLDYTGGGLHSSSQLQEHFENLASEVAGNPHSMNPTSAAMTRRVESARAAVLDYFHADPDEYLAIFTPNASGALKLIGESYPFNSKSQLLLAFDNHNSVNGIREFAQNKKATLRYVPLNKKELRIDEDTLMHELKRSHTAPQKGWVRNLLESLSPPPAIEPHKLFAYCAQSNFSGVKHPLSWIQQAQDLGWDVILDAAAFVPTNQLDLNEYHPDFAVISFYKMFGFPTGLGCLFVKRSTVKKLQRPWFAGGTVSVASVQGGGHFLADNEAAFEDGTVNYLDIPAVEIGLKHINHIGVDVIQRRVLALTGWLIKQFSTLTHSNGQPLIGIFGPQNTQNRGATIALTVLDPHGKAFDERRIESLAGESGISLRTGCFCNPGAGEIAHALSDVEMHDLFASGERVTFEKLRDTIEQDYQKSVSSLRVSMGIASNFSDVFRLVEFMRGFTDRTAKEIGPHHIPKDIPIRDGT